MKRVLAWICVSVWGALWLSAGMAWTAQKKTVSKKTTSSTKKTATAKKTGTAKTATTKKTASAKKTSATRKSSARKSASAKKSSRRRTVRTTWRNRQTKPTQERYKEIQDALAARGYLRPEDADGSWGETSVQALKKFQEDQNIGGAGKINSLSLIALGLGAKYQSTAAVKPAEEPAKPPEQ